MAKTKEQIQRHKKTQEDFTPSYIVNELIHGIDSESTLIGKTVLDNSCGTGNILIGVLKEKLSICNNVEMAFDEIRNIYGIELMADNVETCRKRLYDLFISMFNVNEYDDILLKQIIKNRIQWHDALKFDYDNWPEINTNDTIISFKEQCPEWNEIYPMWKEKPKEEFLLF